MSTRTIHERRARRHRALQRGQAMLEYSLLNWILIMALVLGVTVRIKWTGGQEGNVIDLFLRAYQSYYDSIYFVLNMPFP